MEILASRPPKFCPVPQLSPFYTARLPGAFRYQRRLYPHRRRHGGNTPSTCDDDNYGDGDRVLRHTGGKPRPAYLSPKSNMMGPHSTEEDAAATTAAKNIASNSKASEGHHLPRMSVSEDQQDTPIIVLKSDIIELTGPAPSFLARSSEKKTVQGQLDPPSA